MRHLFLVAAILLVAVPAQAQSAPAPSRVEGPDGAAVFQKACASCHANPASRLARANPRGAAHRRARGDPHCADRRQHVPPGFRDHRRRTPRGCGVSRRTSGGHGAALVNRRTLPGAAGTASGIGARQRLERLGRRRGEHAVSTGSQSGPQRGVGTATEVEMGVSASPASTRRDRSPRSSAAASSSRSENGDVVALDAKTRLHLLELSRAGGHPHGGQRRSVQDGDDERIRGVLRRRRARSPTPSMRNTGREIWRRKLDDHTYARATGSPTVYQGRVYVPIAGVGEEGQGGIARYECCTFRGSVSALDATTGAVVWKSYTITEEPKPRAQERVRRTDVGPRRRRHLGRADDRSRASSRLRHDRQRLLRPATQHDRRRHRDGHGYRQTSLGVSADAERRVDRRLPAGESRRLRIAPRSSGPITTSRSRRC